MGWQSTSMQDGAGTHMQDEKRRSPLDVDFHASLLQEQQAAQALQVLPGCSLPRGFARLAANQRL
jgi:hypothetical protein